MSAKAREHQFTAHFNDAAGPGWIQFLAHDAGHATTRFRRLYPRAELTCLFRGTEEDGRIYYPEVLALERRQVARAPVERAKQGVMVSLLVEAASHSPAVTFECAVLGSAHAHLQP